MAQVVLSTLARGGLLVQDVEGSARACVLFELLQLSNRSKKARNLIWQKVYANKAALSPTPSGNISRISSTREVPYPHMVGRGQGEYCSFFTDFVLDFGGTYLIFIFLDFFTDVPP